MNQQIKDKYQVKFENKIFSSNFGKMSFKIFNSNNALMNAFFEDWTSGDELDRLLIPDIDEVLNGEVAFAENGAEIIPITIYPENTGFLSPDGTNSSIIPTTDFKEIVMAWRDFVMQAPLDGTSV